MGTSWKKQEVSEAFNQYNDMLENILGYEVILDMIKRDKKIARILDFGCGPGKVSAKLASSNKHLDIIAVDQSKTMLDIAEKNRNYDNIQYKLVENNDLSFIESDSIDCIITCFVFINNSNYDKIKPIFKEFQRVLRKGGMLIVLDSNPEAVGESFSTFSNGIKDKHYEIGEEKIQILKIKGQSDLILHDWYWTKECYMDWITNANLLVSDVYEYTIQDIPSAVSKKCLSQYKDYDWGREWNKAPFMIIVATNESEVSL